MTIAIMQPYFMPYIGYIQLLNRVDRFVIYDDVNFINRGWVNRNHILIGGKPNLFTVPLLNASQNKLICEVEVSPDPGWKRKLIKTIDLAYRRAPYHADVLPLVESTLESPYESIAGLCIDGLERIMKYLDLRTALVRSSRVYENGSLKGQERILDICRRESATHYINPIGGRELYEKEMFADQGVRLSFIKSTLTPYPQFKNAFVPWLSIIDVLMFNSPAHVHELLQNFELV